jgi:hypothetical protein
LKNKKSFSKITFLKNYPEKKTSKITQKKLTNKKNYPIKNYPKK